MDPNTGHKGSFLDWLEARVNLTEIVSFLSVFGLLPMELDSRKPFREARIGWRLTRKPFRETRIGWRLTRKPLRETRKLPGAGRNLPGRPRKLPR